MFGYKLETKSHIFFWVFRVQNNWHAKTLMVPAHPNEIVIYDVIISFFRYLGHLEIAVMCNGTGSTILMHEALAKNLMVPAKPSSKSNQKSLIVIGFRLTLFNHTRHVGTRERIYDVLDT